MNPIFTILGFFSGLFKMLGWVKEKQKEDADIAQGVAKQAAQDTKASVAVLQAEEQAVAQAPVSKDQLEDRLDKGTF